LGTLYFEQGRFNDALVPLEMAYKEGIETYELSYYLARIYLKRNKEQEAITLLKKLVIMDSKRYEGHMWLGRAYEAVKDLKNAEAAYFKPIEFLPNNPDVYFEIAEFVYRQRLTDMWHICAAYYEKTLELDTKYPKREQIIANLKLINVKVQKVKSTTENNQ
jgi:Tfp pilus assembly protein PilF